MLKSLGRDGVVVETVLPHETAAFYGIRVVRKLSWKNRGVGKFKVGKS